MARGPLRISRAAQPRTVKHLGVGSLDFALRSVRGGKRAVMEEIAPLAMEFEPRLEPAIRKWLALTPWQRRFVTLDDLAAEAGLTPGEFLGAIARASFEFTKSITGLIIASSYPKVVQASVKRALTPEGIEDRLMLIQYMEEWAARQRADTQPREKTFTEVIGATPNGGSGSPVTSRTDAATPASSDGQPLSRSGRPPIDSVH